jgi:hypothetical protein
MMQAQAFLLFDSMRALGGNAIGKSQVMRLHYRAGPMIVALLDEYAAVLW